MKVTLTAAGRRQIATVEVVKGQAQVDAPGLKLRLVGATLERPREITVQLDEEKPNGKPA